MSRLKDCSYVDFHSTWLGGRVSCGLDRDGDLMDVRIGAEDVDLTQHLDRSALNCLEDEAQAAAELQSRQSIPAHLECAA